MSKVVNMWVVYQTSRAWRWIFITSTGCSMMAWVTLLRWQVPVIFFGFRRATFIHRRLQELTSSISYCTRRRVTFRLVAVMFLTSVGWQNYTGRIDNRAQRTSWLEPVLYCELIRHTSASLGYCLTWIMSQRLLIHLHGLIVHFLITYYKAHDSY